jgi:flagellar biosynthesis GTPase FlhF
MVPQWRGVSAAGGHALREGGMSVAKLFLSGILVASGLVLGAFTLHGYFDPRWHLRQTEAAETRARVSGAWTTSTHVAAGHAVAREVATAQPRAEKTGFRPDAAAPNPEAAEAKAAEVKARKRLAEKKLAEQKVAEKRQAEEARKAEKAAAEQRTTFKWPWNWFAN